MNKTNIDFENYLLGTFKNNKIVQFLMHDINNDNDTDFIYKYSLLVKKINNIDNLNLSCVWKSAIEKNKFYLCEQLPFNKTCNAVHYSLIKYYHNNTLENKEVFYHCLNETIKISTHIVEKTFKNLKLFIKPSFSTTDLKKCTQCLTVLEEIDFLYRKLNPPNPDKFLKAIIVTQGKEIELLNTKQLLSHNLFFSNVTIPLIEKLIKYNGPGIIQLNNKKPSESLNKIYEFFQKFQFKIKIEEKFKHKVENTKVNKKMKI